MRRALLFLSLLACDPPTAPEHCLESCRFYSECDPELEPLEAMCITSCQERFADPKRIVVMCADSEPRHPADLFRELPLVEESAIEAGQCALRQGCPPEMPDLNATDPCDGIERICLDELTPEQRCNRDSENARYRCQEEYQACFERGDDPNACQTQINDCYNQAQMIWQSCS